MKVECWVIGKTAFSYLEEGVDTYIKRLHHYLPFEFKQLPDVKNAKNLSKQQLKQKEGDIILNALLPTDQLILLDENGKQFSSVAFSKLLEQLLMSSQKRAIFLIGGAYGFSKAVYERSNRKISLSQMTFSHQMVRLIFLEQLYRGMTILKNEPYHHE